ncbi:MAG TPA: glycosyltransferase, partial [Thermoanaerobaculia bacterium]|nr:glycosyltransferase [Thermoanaerobaculia bacterium]
CEALAAGAPLVLSDIRAHRELAEAAMLVPPHDVEATARAIRAILAERPVARVERGLALAQHWSVEAMASAYEAVYVKALRA